MKIKLNTPEGGILELEDEHGKRFLAAEANLGINHEVLDDAAESGTDNDALQKTVKSGSTRQGAKG